MGLWCVHMDVSCPRCKTEYELEDARVPDDGVTVKCTQCAHVFRVKKKALVMTLPVKPEEAHAHTELPPPAPNREWKIRQANGNVYSCRELTTLQKWIIEGKVARDDEISLTGETWKRLGNIPELASFFQVVEDAQRARALEALRSVSQKTQPAAQAVPPAPAAGLPPIGGITDTWREPGFKAPFPSEAGPQQPQWSQQQQQPPVSAPTPQPQWAQQPPPPPPVTAPPQQQWAQPPQQQQPPPPPPMSAPPQYQQPQQPPPMQGRPSSPGLKETLREQSFSVPPPRYERPPPIDEDEDDFDKVKGGKGKWVAFALIGIALGGAAGYYFAVYAPEQERLELQRKADARAAEDTQREETARLEREKAAEAMRRAAEAAADAGPPDAGPAVVAAVDAGAPDAGPPDAGKKEKPVVKDFDYYLAQGDRLREREKAEQALDAYGQAADLEPERVEPLAGRGLALLDMGQPLAAQAAFEQALKLDGRYGPAIMGLAESYRMQNKNELAVTWYQKYLDVRPNGSEADVARNNIERLKK